MVKEAGITTTEDGHVPQGEGWYVLNAQKARWHVSEAMGSFCNFEGDSRFSEFGFNLSVLWPEQPSCMYHREDVQEDFLVLKGECLLLVEGEERHLKAWDFVHCPPWTEHVFVGAGSGPCVVIAAGSRRPDGQVVYPESELAQRHGAGVEQETSSAQEAYARFAPLRAGPLEDASVLP